jgi:hypothetical protein
MLVVAMKNQRKENVWGFCLFGRMERQLELHGNIILPEII